ncbi:hypothetical protein, partial [Lysinibacillus sp. NPDC086135]|uniref:hypothetical protein n=1 Tax=Lysinibacillus sp. NPDC086135 TaxID=3364130 RepID=UPI00383B5CB0
WGPHDIGLDAEIRKYSKRGLDEQLSIQSSGNKPRQVQLAACSVKNLTGVRDQAVLVVAFTSGGRRRSEIASLRA